MRATTSQTTGVSIVYSTVCLGVDQKKTSKLRVTGLRGENSSVGGEFPVQSASNAEMLPFNDVIMANIYPCHSLSRGLSIQFK